MFAWGGRIFTFVTFERRDGGVRLLLQLQQRDLSRAVPHEGVLRLVVISGRAVRVRQRSVGLRLLPLFTLRANQGYCRQEAQAVK